MNKYLLERGNLRLPKVPMYRGRAGGKLRKRERGRMWWNKFFFVETCLFEEAAALLLGVLDLVEDSLDLLDLSIPRNLLNGFPPHLDELLLLGPVGL